MVASLSCGSVPFHLIPTAEMAPRVLLPGDPGRALALAQLLLDGPRMANHARGLWGYTGVAADGDPLTIQSTGIGGASTAAVLEDLAGLGVQTAVRLGTCRADGTDPALGSVLVVGRALAQDGVGGAGGRGTALPHPDLAGDAVVVSRDRLGAGPTGAAPVADRTTAAFLVVGAQLGLRCGALLAVSADALGGRLDADALLVAEHALGRAGAALLGVPAREAVA
jgi:Phosphorylase superfamily